MISDIRAGIGYVFEHSELKKLIVFYAIAFILLTPAMVLSPLMVERTFGNEVWRLTAMKLSGLSVLLLEVFSLHLESKLK